MRVSHLFTCDALSITVDSDMNSVNAEYSLICRCLFLLSSLIAVHVSAFLSISQSSGKRKKNVYGLYCVPIWVHDLVNIPYNVKILMFLTGRKKYKKKYNKTKHRGWGKHEWIINTYTYISIYRKRRGACYMNRGVDVMKITKPSCTIIIII